MSDRYRQAIVIEGEARNHVESVINDLRKQLSKGRVEFGVDVEMRRIDLNETDVDGFEDE